MTLPKLTNHKARALLAAQDAEDDIHIRILNLLSWILPKTATPAWHTPNGGKRDKRTGVKMKALGTKPGYPDISFLFNSKLYTLEVKSSTGKQSDDQDDWEKWITDAGGFYAIVRSTDDVRAALKQWQIILNRN